MSDSGKWIIVLISWIFVDPTGVHQPGVMVQQPGMYYNAGAGIQHPPPQQGAYCQPQAGSVGYQPQPQTSAGYQPPPAYTQEETKSVHN